jgi:hypothetical protein
LPEIGIEKIKQASPDEFVQRELMPMLANELDDRYAK